MQAGAVPGDDDWTVVFASTQRQQSMFGYVLAGDEKFKRLALTTFLFR